MMTNLQLESGEIFQGQSFGFQPQEPVVGELVFSTGMVGYVESLTDPSFRGQILVMTYPLIGNYGVPGPKKNPEAFESNQIQVAGLIIAGDPQNFHHWKATQSLHQWLEASQVPGIYGIDTRALTILIRERGTIPAAITNPSSIQTTVPIDFTLPETRNLVAEVSTPTPFIIEPPQSNTQPNTQEVKTVMVIDCGLKNNQLRCLQKHAQFPVRLHIVPWDFDFMDPQYINSFDYLFISNGPGNPETCRPLINRLQKYLELESQKPPDQKIRPIFGICLGHQILALATGAETYKLKYGNRGLNIPCRLMQTKCAIITSQNHGYAVDASTLANGWHPLFTNANDESNEGIYHDYLPFFSVQFHPEAKPGPEDSEFLFDLFYDYSINNLWKLIKLKPNPPPSDLISSVKKPRKVLILGSGGLSIGQSGEFDYSGSQAIKAYQEEGIKTVLINPNIATIQTSPGFADKVYYLPVTPEYVLKVIKIERPDAITLSFGGQTALNCGVQLYHKKIFEKYNIQILGSPIKSVITTEDRELFKTHLTKIQQPFIESTSTYTIEEAIDTAESIKYPVLVRAAYALGGLGSGFANNREELIPLLKTAFANSDQVMIDKSLKGWKELEYEVVRDSYGNTICVCNMENIDPLGVHTGESIVIAPSQTLDDTDYQTLRTAAIETIQSLNIVGECNIQFALDPKSRQYYVIEVNARLSRSSALASKATGYPLAYMAAKLSLGYSLTDVKNSMTQKTCAMFEPSLDYVVVKVPRWDLRKFPEVNPELDSAMKSIGESMGIARSFEEAFQKALRMADEQIQGFEPQPTVNHTKLDIWKEISTPTPQRQSVIAYLLQTEPQFSNIERIYQQSGIDRFFLLKMENIANLSRQLQIPNQPPNQTQPLDKDLIQRAKALGFSDKQIAQHAKSTELTIRNLRQKYQLHPFVRQIDTVAAEFPCFTNYLYTTYSASQQHDIPLDQPTTIILGSGVYKIGSSVEFDWCSVNAVRALRKRNHHTTMINCNPETVSTDFDEADSLYFDELTFERVMDIYQLQNKNQGILLSVGGQVANNMAMALYRQYVKIIGTSPEVIDMAENRFKFSRLLDRLNIKQPEWKELTSLNEALNFCQEAGYPCLIRPSYVLSGMAMTVCYSDDDVNAYLNNPECIQINKEHPVVISKYITDAKEIEVDAVASNHQLKVISLAEHVENAGVHSGDSTIIIPVQDVTPTTQKKIKQAVKKLVENLEINGPFNMQFMVKDEEIQVIECNLRVSRTFPFVSKSRNINLIEIAIDSILDPHIQPHQPLQPPPQKNRIGVKAPKFSFSRLKGADFKLGVEMVSTGEVACYGSTKYEAYLKAITATEITLPPKNGGILIALGTYNFKQEFVQSAKLLETMGYQLYGTRGTTDFLISQNIRVTEIDFDPSNTSYTHNFYSLIQRKRLHLILNVSRISQATNQKPSKHQPSNPSLTNQPSIQPSTIQPSTQQPTTQSQGYHIRRTAVNCQVPLITDIKTAKFFVQALKLFHDHQRKIWIDTTVDCFTNQNLVKLPGLIDVHVHMREPGGEHKEDWESGTKAAIAGGITTVCAMPNTNPAITTPEALNLVENLAQAKAHCDYMLYVGANETNHQYLYQFAPRASSLKMYLNNTYGPLLLKDTLAWSEHIKNWPTSKRPLCVHAEGETLPAVLHIANLHKKPIHVCHVARRSEIEIIKLSKQNNQPVTCEVAPHHLFLSEEDLKQLKSCGGVKPPLMTLDDQQALWENIDIIDCFATDHAPHTIEEKNNPDPNHHSPSNSSAPTSPHSPPGFPGLETALPLLLTAVKQGRLTLNQIIEKYHTNPIKIFKIPLSQEYLDTTYIEVDLDKTYTLPNTTKFCKAKWTPFAGMTVSGSVERVILRNKVVYVDGEILSQPGYGLNLRTDIPQLYQSETQQSTTQQRSETPDNSLRESTAQIVEGESTATQTSGNPFANIRHVTSVEQFTRDHLTQLFDLTEQLRTAKRQQGIAPEFLQNRVLGLIFYEASTRTKCSFSAAMKRLGGQVIEIEASQSSAKKGESFSDFVKCIEQYTDIIAIRNSQSGSLKELTEQSTIPIISAGDGTGEHPTQALLDVYTIRKERGTVNNLTITLVGDLKHGRTVHSLAKLLTLYSNITLQYVSPPGFEMPEDVQDYVTNHHIPQKSFYSIDDALPTTDVLYMTRIQLERFEMTDDLKQILNNNQNAYRLTPAQLTRAKENLVIMHPLPRVDEIDPAIDNDPRAAYFRQMKNGMYVRMALLTLLLNPTFS